MKLKTRYNLLASMIYFNWKIKDYIIKYVDKLVQL